MTAILSFSMGRLYAENVSKTWKLSEVKGLKGQLYFAILYSLEIWKYSKWKNEMLSVKSSHLTNKDDFEHYWSFPLFPKVSLVFPSDDIVQSCMT